MGGVNLTEALKSGDMTASLEAMRDAIAADLDVCESMRDRAALYLRLADVLARLDDARPAVVKGDPIDEIAARRAARRASSAAKGASRSTGSS